MSKPRISTHQLQHLLTYFPVATNESVLIGMYRKMLCDALLDLRDAIGEQARLQWYVNRQAAGIKATKEILLKMALRPGGKGISDNDYSYLSSTLDWADEHPKDDIEKEAIAPLTGKEKSSQ